MEKKVIIFDADGVLLPGGEKMKDAAWDEMALSITHPIHTSFYKWQQAITTARGEFGAGRGSGSRYDIIAHALTATGRPSQGDEPTVQTWADAYNGTVQRMILKLGIYPETRTVLETLSTAGYKLYVNTATPKEALTESLVALDLRKFFVDVYGQPETKVQNLQSIATREGVPVTTLIFVGDGTGDIRAATEVDCTFIGVTNDSNHWTTNNNFALITRLDELRALL